MLQIKNISKTYKTGDLVQRALNGVSLNLRDNEFVAILGQSGSGKTTLLNIIGGLDRYDNGDLIINGVSTKKYKDRDWNTYRNHTIGFVFQSYNLIPHQTVLSNVELALTIGGVSASERKARALKALDEVGLKDQAHKKPNQMSGGQMQRVAIARALVNNPDILLADEPTGALDSKTSIQVMELLKQVANDRLVVMVTHNPDLANDYANRIVRLQDGQIVADSNPYNPDVVVVKKKAKKHGKARMNFLTALSLSFNNLLTKKGRTILTAFAGSIGIIGIALILSLSQGFQNYIDKIQEDTLSSYPLSITSETADMTSAILSMVSDRKENTAEGDKLVERQYLSTMFSSIGTNDLKSFKSYIEKHQDEVDQYCSSVKYQYSVTPIIYTVDSSNNLAKLNPNSLWNTLYSSSATNYLYSSSMGGMGIFTELNDDYDSYEEKYDVLAGRWPQNYDEMIIVLSEPNSISDLLIYSLGLRDTAELKTIISDVMTDGETDIKNEPMNMTYEDLLNIDLRLINATDTYKYNSKYDVYEDMSDDDTFMRDAYDNALKLKIVGVMCPKESGDTLALQSGVNYTKELTQYVIDTAKNTAIVQSQLRNKDVDVFSGKSFDEANENSKDNSKLNFNDMVSVDEDILKDAFKINISEDDFAIDQNALQDIITDSITEQGTIMGQYYQNILGFESKLAADKITTYMFMNSTFIPVTYLDLTSSSSVAYTVDELTTKVSTYSTDDNFKNTVALLKTEDYPYLTNTVNAIISKFFTTLSSSYTFETNKVHYTMNGSDITFGDTPNTISTTNLYTQILTDETVLGNANIIINRIISSKCIEMITNGVISASTNTAIEVGTSIGSLFGEDMMEVDTDKFAEAFKFDMSEDELSRLMETMLSGTDEKSYSTNLISLGYQDIDDPSTISLYFEDFDAKEGFLDFIDKYNEGKDEEDQIRYTDITGILMSSVKTIVDSVTYVLIAFVSISLVVSSIMIAVITLISVMERTKEIGILRAMGASKKNVSSIFNAETFIIGLLSGLIGVGFTFGAIPFINKLIHDLTGNYDINAVLPNKYAIILVLISVFLTIIAGIIPSRKAAKQDPVIALRTE